MKKRAIRWISKIAKVQTKLDDTSKGSFICHADVWTFLGKKFFSAACTAVDDGKKRSDRRRMHISTIISFVSSARITNFLRRVTRNRLSLFLSLSRGWGIHGCCEESNPKCYCTAASRSTWSLLQFILPMFFFCSLFSLSFLSVSSARRCAFSTAFSMLSSFGILENPRLFASNSN